MKTTAAKCASEIRKDLKAAFPLIKFSVRSETYSMGNSVNIEWMDGQERKEVESVVSKYQQGHFNGMEDIYEYSNYNREIPQAKFVFCTRRTTKEVAYV